MKTEQLKPFVEPVIEKPSCVACKAFAPDCLVPVGEGAVPMCWYCAHHVVDHDVAIHHAHAAECECPPEAVFPKHVLDARRFQLVMPIGKHSVRRQPS